MKKYVLICVTLLQFHNIMEHALTKCCEKNMPQCNGDWNCLTYMANECRMYIGVLELNYINEVCK